MGIREYSNEWISNRPKNTAFTVADLYSYITSQFRLECASSGYTPDGEEKWKKDARWALQDSKFKMVITHVGSTHSGKWQRLERLTPLPAPTRMIQCPGLVRNSGDRVPLHNFAAPVTLAGLITKEEPLRWHPSKKR